MFGLIVFDLIVCKLRLLLFGWFGVWCLLLCLVVDFVILVGLVVLVVCFWWWLLVCLAFGGVVSFGLYGVGVVCYLLVVSVCFKLAVFCFGVVFDVLLSWRWLCC